MIRRLWLAVAIWLTAGIAPALADDAFYRISLDELSRPREPESAERHSDIETMILDWNRESFFRPYVSLDGKGEAYVVGRRFAGDRFSRSGRERLRRISRPTCRSAQVFVRAPAGADLTAGCTSKRNLSGMIEIDFKIPPCNCDEKYRHDFYAAEAFHYGQLVREQRPGSLGFATNRTRLARRWERSPSRPRRFPA